MSENKDTTVSVVEDKFNAVVTLTVTGVENKDNAKRFARQYFQDEYGHSPSNIVAEEETGYPTLPTTYELMVADHSSGSLKVTTEYDV